MDIISLMINEKVELNELTYRQLMRKQDSITKLHPQFHTRVKSVANNGGVRLKEQRPELWHFKVASGTTKGKKYDIQVKWNVIADQIQKHANTAVVWTKDKERIDLRKLATQILYGADMQLVCSCPADIYYGGQYIRTQRNAKYTQPENRPPTIRNKKQYGAFCKHVELVMEVLPFYVQSMSSYLKRFYMKEIEKSKSAALEASAARVAARKQAKASGGADGSKNKSGAENKGRESNKANQENTDFEENNVKESIMSMMKVLA